MENLIWEDDILSYDIALSKVDNFAINMLKETSKDTNIAEIHYSKNKNKFIFSFEDYTPLSSVIENTVGTKEVLNILIQICDCINYSKISMLFENNLIFDIDYIFIDTNTNQLKMLYIPVQEKISNINIKNFFKELMFDFDVEDYLTIKDIFKRISSKDFNLNSFYDYLVEKLHKLNNVTTSNLPPVVEELPIEAEDFEEDVPIEEEDIPIEEVTEAENDSIQSDLDSEEETTQPPIEDEEDEEIEIEQEEIIEDNTNTSQDNSIPLEDDDDDTIFFNQVVEEDTIEETPESENEEEDIEFENDNSFHIYDDEVHDEVVPNEYNNNDYETSNDNTLLLDEDNDEDEDKEEDDDASSIFEGFSLDDDEEEEESSSFDDTSISSEEDVSVPSIQHTDEPKVEPPLTDTYSNSNKSNEEFSFEDMLKYSNNITDLSSNNTNNDYIEFPNNKNVSLNDDMVATLTRCKDNYSKVIDKQYFIIGKSENTDFKIEDNITVSRSHATIIHKPDGYYINDNGSKNGTWVNDIKIGLLDNFKLQDNDRIVLSSKDELLIFHLTKKED